MMKENFRVFKIVTSSINKKAELFSICHNIKIYLLSLLFFLSLTIKQGYGQKPLITGKVIDSVTNQPVSFANVFLTNAAKNTQSLQDGGFTLSSLEPGKYLLVVSCVGYERYTQSVLIGAGSTANLVVYLRPEAISLQEVIIGNTPNAKRRSELVKQFSEVFFGESPNAPKCSILNPESLKIVYDKKAKVLRASSTTFLRVSNNALGYQLNILLDEFSYNYEDKFYSYRGQFYFVEMDGSNAEVRKWKRRRAETYLGSIRHFLKSAINNTMKDEGFTVHPIIANNDSFAVTRDLVDRKIEQFKGRNKDSLAYWTDLRKSLLTHFIVMDRFFNEQDLVSDSFEPGLYELKFDQHIYLISEYKARITRSGNSMPLTTILTQNSGRMIFDANGVFTRSESVLSESSATETVADLLPVDYILSKKDEQQFALEKYDSKKQPSRKYQYLEKLYLHSDRDYYLTGETIWFSVYLVNARNNTFSDHSSQVYAELLNTDNKIIARNMLRTENGGGRGDFLLADSLATGTYRLRAYTNWMRNFGYDFVFEKKIHITAKVLPTSKNSYLTSNTVSEKTVLSSPFVSQPASGYLISFYPEGGSLVEDIYSKVAFKITDSCGNPSSMPGKIVSSKGDIVCSLVPLSNGTGFFMLKPQKGLTYFCIDNQGNKTPLPHALAEGYSVFVQEKDSLYNLLITTNYPTLKRNGKNSLGLIVKHNGIVLATAQVIMKAVQQNITLSKSVFYSGINVLSLVDAAGRTVAERLLFLDEMDTVKVSVKSDKQVYSSREITHVSIDLANASNVPLKGRMSLSVIRSNLYNREKDNIKSYLMLSSEIKGKILSPSQYFDSSNSERKKALDLLLLTQGWRDYLWKYQEDSLLNLTAFEAEKGILIKGTLNRSEPKLTGEAEIGLYLPGSKSQRIYSSRTDSLGRYTFLLDDVYGEQIGTLTAVNARAEPLGELHVKQIIVDTLAVPSANAYEGSACATDTIHNPFGSLSRYGQLSKSMQLKDVIIKGRNDHRLLEGNFTAFGNPVENFEIGPADYSFNNLKHFLLTRSRYAVPDQSSTIYICNGDHTGCQHQPIVKKFPGVCTCGEDLEEVFTESRDRVMFRGDDSLTLPRIFINDKQLAINESDSEEYKNNIYQQYLNMLMKDIKSVRISKGLLNNEGGSKTAYLLFINLKTELPKPEKGKLNITLPGYYNAQVFYAPNYKEGSSIPLDMRPTVFWKASILSDGAGKASESFYNSDMKGSFSVIVQGLTENGRPFYTSSEYEVK